MDNYMHITADIYFGTILGLACIIASLGFLLHDEYKAHKMAKLKIAYLYDLLSVSGYAAEIKLINERFDEK